MHFAFVIDALDSLKPYKDSSIDLMVESARRQHRVSILEYDQISLHNGELRAKATEVSVDPEVLNAKKASPHVQPVGPAKVEPIERFDAVFIRKDPPYDTQYLALSYLLDRSPHERRFINSPRGLREVNEKLFATRYSQHAPSTLITWDLEQAQEFAAQYERVVLKPMYLGSGAGVALSSRQDAKFEGLVRGILGMQPPGPVIVQEYLTEGRNGDARVMLLDGVPVAAVGRRPPAGDFRANIAVGGEAFAVELSAEQTRIASELGAELRKLGIVFAGLDFIGDRLIETNVTSPTLIQELRRVSGFDMSKRLIDFVESRG